MSFFNILDGVTVPIHLTVPCTAIIPCAEYIITRSPNLKRYFSTWAGSDLEGQSCMRVPKILSKVSVTIPASGAFFSVLVPTSLDDLSESLNTVLPAGTVTVVPLPPQFLSCKH